MKQLLMIAVRSALAGIAVVVAYQQLPALFEAWETEQTAQWWAARSSGFVAQLALTMSMLFGLMISSRGLDGGVNRATVLDHHQQWTLAAVIALVVHVLVIVTDDYSSITLAGALVPGVSAELAGPVALGAIAFWGVLLLTLSSWLRPYMSFSVWRIVHTLALAAFIMGLVHGMTAGTDTELMLFQVLYVGSGSAIIGAIIFRFLHVARRKATPAAVEKPTVETARS